MTTAVEIAAALPDNAFRNGYYGARVVSMDWANKGFDRASITTTDPAEYERQSIAAVTERQLANTAALRAMLPALDDAAGWSALSTALRAELDSNGQELAGRCEAALRPVLLSARRSGVAVCAEADCLLSWLGARALGQVGAHVISEQAAAQRSITRVA